MLHGNFDFATLMQGKT